MFIRFTVLVLTILLFWSCEEVVDLDVDFDPQIVVVSEVAPRRAATVTLSRSRSILSETDTEFVLADQVTLTNQGTGLETELFLEEGVKDTLNPDRARFPFYLSDVPQVISGTNTYELNIKVEGENPISAVTTIPRQVEIQSLELVDFSANPDPRSERIFDIDFDFTFFHDVETADNYHVAFYFTYLVEEPTDTDTVLFFVAQIPNIESIETRAIYTKDFENGILIQGDGLEDGILGLKGSLSVTYDEELSPFPPELWVELRNTNSDYNNYHFNLARQQSQRDSIISQAILVPSNINNGLGIFSGYNFDQDRIQLAN